MRVQLASACFALSLIGSAWAQEAAVEVPVVQDAPQAPPTIVSIDVVGATRYPEEQLLRSLGVRVGQPLDLDALDRGVEEIWRAFRARTSVEASEVPGGVALVLRVNEMPVDLEPRFVGNVDFDEEELREWARIGEGQELYVNEAQRVRERLLTNYRSHGYYFAEVNVVERAPPADAGAANGISADVIFEILEGPQVEVKDVLVSGNRAFPDGGSWFWKRGLKARAGVELDRSPWLGFFRDDFVEEDLEADLLAMREVYRAHGYLDVVVELDRLEFNDARDLVTIHVAVDEGPQYKVSRVDLAGVEVEPGTAEAQRPRYRRVDLLYPEAELRALLELGPGDVYTRSAVRADERKLRDWYGERGHVAHSSLSAGERWTFAEPELTFDPARHEVAVTYRIAQGRQVFLREILFTGAEHTQDRVMRRLVEANPGEVADLVAIQKSLNRIRSTGYFSDPRDPVGHPEPTFRFQDTADPAWKDLEFRLEEGNVLGFDFQAGVGGDVGVFGLVEMRMRNVDLTDWPDSFSGSLEEIAERRAFHGAGQELTLRLNPGTEFSSYLFRFREPDLFATHEDRIDLELEFEKNLRRRDTHDEEREESSVRFGNQVGQDGRVWLGFTLADILIDDLDESGEPSLGNPLHVPALLKAQEGESRVTYLETGYAYRVSDRSFAPREGRSHRVTLQLSEESLGSDFDFARLVARNEWFGLFGEEDGSARDGWFAAFDVGLSAPYGDTQDVPYSERFFLGGSRNLRGFDYQGVGPNENGDAIGGQTMLNATLEYRHPLVTSTPAGALEEVEVLKALLFVDAGVLDPDTAALDPDEVRMSVGFGLGFGVPFPIGFTLGFPVMEGEGDDLRAFNLSIFSF